MNRKNISARRARGFSILELCIAMTISLVMMGMAIPAMRGTTFLYRLNGAVSSVTTAIQSTRYQSLMRGYRYRMVITPSTRTYQLMSMVPPATTYSNVGSAIPVSGSQVTISAATTLEFRPNGQVSATTGALNFTMSYQGTTKTITVSTYGSVNVQ